MRGRFRRNQPWIKLAKGPQNHEIVQCTASIGANYEILAAVLEIHGLKLQKVGYLAREEGVVKNVVRGLFQKYLSFDDSRLNSVVCFN